VKSLPGEIPYAEFPCWGSSYGELLRHLERSEMRFRRSHTFLNLFQIPAVCNRGAVDRSVDLFGEFVNKHDNSIYDNWLRCWC
jgi:hypothetical protein